MLKLSLAHNKSRTHNISYDVEPFEKNIIFEREGKHIQLRRLVVYLVCSNSTQLATPNIHYASKIQLDETQSINLLK
ncbi:hypothetical protein EUGRSUZ_I00212 [Eucalyptus grandis]|uniref:Uncharacterized protein n=2 Tax=Eucalyptus grandis TaxID=71139 RepID=A0ACC3JD53_EUCGR|nr:hypothetical protein EUGRSUZ_I00212 [Eucalyptus grandis]